MKKITKAIENAVINWYANENAWAGIEINGYPYIVAKHQVYKDGEWTTDDGFDVFPAGCGEFFDHKFSHIHNVLSIQCP